MKPVKQCNLFEPWAPTKPSITTIFLNLFQGPNQLRILLGKAKFQIATEQNFIIQVCVCGCTNGQVSFLQMYVLAFGYSPDPWQVSHVQVQRPWDSDSP